MAAKGRRAAQAAAVVRAVAAPHRAPSGGLVLAYHDVTEDGRSHAPYTVSAKAMADQLDHLTSVGYRFTTAAAMASDPAAHDRCVAVTFDDGYRDFRAVAAPILAARGIPATVFIPSDLLGQAPWWSATCQPLMDERELRKVADLPLVDVGAHGRFHVALSALAPEAQHDELAGSRRRLQELLGRPVYLIAYPYGSYDSATPGLVEASGYLAGFTFANGRVTASASRYLLPRVVMHEGQRGIRWRYTVARSDRSYMDHQRPTVHATGRANSFPERPT